MPQAPLRLRSASSGSQHPTCSCFNSAQRQSIVPVMQDHNPVSQKNRQLWQPNASDATCQRVSSLLRVTLLYIQAGLYLTLYSAQQCTCCQRAVNKSPRNCFFGALVFVLSHRISTISRLLMGTFAILCNRQITASHICLSELQVL